MNTRTLPQQMKQLNAPPRQRFRWQTWTFLLAAAVPMFFGCSTPLVIDHAIGPNPFGVSNAASNGELQVFTMAAPVNDVGFEFPYSQRTGYSIRASNGKLVARVNDNNCGHFDDTPRIISLTPGTYSIEALMSQGLGQLTILNVVIEGGRKTEVHLDGKWRSASDSPKNNQVVRAPNGFLIGWTARPSSN
jgi:hypothetical protein